MFDTRYKLEDLHIGMEVNITELMDIYGVYITLKDVHIVHDELGSGSFSGIINRISKEPLKLQGDDQTLFYRDPAESEECFFYES